MSFCSSNKDCSSSQTCINSKCETQSTKLSTGAYIGIGIAVFVVLGIIIAICVRAQRSSKKDKEKKYAETQSHPMRSQEQGPAPLPSGYKKPVDLLQVAEQNRRLEEAEELKSIQEQQRKSYVVQSNYVSECMDGPYVTVPLNQVYVLSQNSPVRPSIVPNTYFYNQPSVGSAPLIVGQQHLNPQYEGGPQRSHSVHRHPSNASKSSYSSTVMVDSDGSNVTRIPQYVPIVGNIQQGQQVDKSYDYPVAPPRSGSPHRIPSSGSNTSDLSRRNMYEAPPRSCDKSPENSGRDLSGKSNSVRAVKNLPSLPTANSQ